MEEIIERFWHRVYLNLENGYTRACIDRAYLDFCRTLRLSNYSAETWKTIQEELSQILLSRIEILFQTKMVKQQEFDQWHQTTMLHLVSKGEIEALTNTSTYLTIGQAQKWVNMSLKYMFAVGEKYIPNAWANYTYYHVPIDSIIQKKLAKHGVEPLSMAWSRLDEIYRYDEFQRSCRAAFPGESLILVEMELFNEVA